MNKHILFLLILSIVYSLSWGQTPTSFRHITYKDGLSNNHISSFVEDNNGFLWIGTINGLNRYDGYNIKTYTASSDTKGLPDNSILAMIKDQLGRIWLKLPVGICLLNPEKDEFITDKVFTANGTPFPMSSFSLITPYSDSILLFYIQELVILKHNLYNNRTDVIELGYNEKSITGSTIITDMTAKGDTLFVMHNTGLIELYSLQKNKVLDRIKSIELENKGKPHYYRLYVDNKSNLWAYARDFDYGLYRINLSSKIIHRLYTGSTPKLNSNVISEIIEDGDNNIWIGTDHGGINVFNQDNNTINYITKTPLDNTGLSQNVITSLHISSDSTIWIGTFKQGANYYNPNTIQFKHFVNNPFNKNSLPYNDVNCFVEEENGNIWIGTNGEGLLYFDRSKNNFTQYRSDNTKKGLRSDVIVSLYIDKENILWIGTYHGGLSRYDGKEFTNYSHDPDDPKSINDDKVWEIFEDSKGNLWIGLLMGGLDVFDRKKQQFYHFFGTGINSVNTNLVMDITEDKDGTVWFATNYGIYYYTHVDARFRQYKLIEEDSFSISDNFVYKVFVDANNNLWAGTRNGLNLLNRNEGTFKQFYKEHGLSSNTIKSILESLSGDLFLSTPNGITKFSPKFNENGRYKSHITVNYDESDGLQGQEFNEGSSLRTNKGELIFGGANGFNMFLPEDNSSKQKKLVTHIVGINTYNADQGLPVNIKGNEILTNTVLDKASIKIPYDVRMFSIEFVAIDFRQAKKIDYRYKLDGFNEQWIYTDWEDRKATYTNLNPGKYKFIVQASDYISDWNVSETSIILYILPPWYRTIVAYCSFIIIIALMILWLRNAIRKRERNKIEQEQVIKESERQFELNRLKTRFFTNVSHEFRTPLTLILTPLDKILREDIGEHSRPTLELVNKNANRLLSLINQLLDFRKAEEKKLRLNLIYGNIVNLIDRTVNSFSDLKESKQIVLRHLPHTPELFMQFDKSKIEKIMFNLLSNAFKFTPDKGYINVITEITTQNNNETFQIRVEDNGIGIDKETADKVFERFYQVDLPTNLIAEGSGIGLSLTKDFVELHKGKISVNSMPGKGSVFIIELPIHRNPLSNKLEDPDKVEVSNKTITDHKTEIQPFNDKKNILLVEDNEDFRNYLKVSLSHKFNIMEAENGNVALDLIKKTKQNLIVSDIMMPEIDGLQLCKEIKTNFNYSHIPIILLTAKSTEADKLEGLKQGADEYLTKPFSFDILEARIEYLLNIREGFIQSYQKTFVIGNDTSAITDLDEKFLKKTLDLVKKNMATTDFSVVFLSSELGMSRVNLYNKLISLTGKSPVEFIRMVRLKRAEELLVQNQLNVSEIAYDLGYSDPKYFSKQFKAEFGVLPSKYKESLG